MNKKNILILCGGQSVEHEISLVSAQNIISAIDQNLYNIIIIGISKQGEWQMFSKENFFLGIDAKNIKLPQSKETVALTCINEQGYLINSKKNKIPIHIAFPIIHGSYGEDGSIQGMLRMMNIPYIGCNHTSSAICMDKAICKTILRSANIPVANDIIVTQSNFSTLSPDACIAKLGLPIFVKPARLGSSIGISKVENSKQLLPAIEQALNFDNKILLETSIIGREIECAILGNSDAKCSELGEIIVTDNFYSYQAKYISKTAAKLQAPTKVTNNEKGQLQQIALNTFYALGCSGMARVDMFLTNKGEIFVNEVNTIPGFTAISMYPKLWELSGIDKYQLISKLIKAAQEQFAQEAKLQKTIT